LKQSIQWKRSCTCGQLRKENAGENVVLMGWVSSHRDHGGLIFIDLRDRWGITQIVFHPSDDTNVYETAKGLRLEFVIGVKGNVNFRPDGMVNKDLPTGHIEVIGKELKVYNESRPLPFLIKDPCEATDELRLKYRYLDLRRPSMQKNIILRHQMAQIVRRFFDENGFIEIETPFLMKSTPEGARDYLVPSRIHKGNFYALPQSPQTYKQLLMISGYERYFQIVRCFRDEDLRADRQPEFTQIDVEMSFVDENDIMEMVEGLMKRLFQDTGLGSLPEHFSRLSYSQAMEMYGTDCPDLRFGMEIKDVTSIVAESAFRVFTDTVQQDGTVRGICLENSGPVSRKTVDDLTQFVQDFGAKGLIVIQKKSEEMVSPITKFVSTEIMDRICEAFNAKIGDTLFLVAGEEKVCCEALGHLRKKLAFVYNRIDKERFEPVWITDFPLLEWSDEGGRYNATHHPFTSPKAEDLNLLDSSPEKVCARAYDLVMNGSEIAGGSIRIYQRAIQEKMFDILGLDRKTAMKKFGFLIEALEYGAPPHGGIAFGFDRMVMIFTGEESIREVIAFPKTTSALSLMDDSPSPVDSKQLRELGLKIETGDGKL